MKIRVTDIKTVAGAGLLYVDVAFLDDQRKVVHRNDFVMQIAPTYQVYLGELGLNGEILDPEAFEERQTDVAAVILTNIRAYLARHPDLRELPADYRDPRIRREDSDPLGLRTRPGVAELVRAETDV